MEKPIIHYTDLSYCVVGERASLRAMDHPNHRNNYINHGERVSTSPVQYYDEESGRIETLYSIYIPEEENV